MPGVGSGPMANYRRGRYGAGGPRRTTWALLGRPLALILAGQPMQGCASQLLSAVVYLAVANPV
jgi:hypothetical protein